MEQRADQDNMTENPKKDYLMFCRRFFGVGVLPGGGWGLNRVRGRGLTLGEMEQRADHRSLINSCGSRLIYDD